MQNVLLGIDFGKRAGLMYDLAEQKIYYKDTFLLMLRLDGPNEPQERNVNDVPTGVTDLRFSLPENDPLQIEDLRDTQVGVVNLIVRLADPVRLPARTQMAVKYRFEPAVCEDTVVLLEPTHDLLEKHGVCLAKGLIPLTPEAGEEQLIMANTMDQNVWLRCWMTVERAMPTEGCEIHGMDAEDQTQARLETVRRTEVVMTPTTAWNIGPNRQQSKGNKC